MLWRLLLFSVAVGGYVFLRAVWPLAWPRRYKCAAGVALALVALRLPALTVWCAESPYTPNLPAWANIAYSWLFIALLIWFCCIFAGHIMRLTVLRFAAAWRTRSPKAQQAAFNRLHAALLGGALLVSALGTIGGLRPPIVREVHIPCPRLREPLRVALLADLHVSPLRSQTYLQQIVERTNALGADLICIVGDFVDGPVPQCAQSMQPLGSLRAPLGVYGVPGNHDYYSGYHEWRDFLSAHGVCMLDNAHAPLPGSSVTLAGVTEQTARNLPGMAPPSLPAALRGAPAGRVTLLLSHRPDVVAEAAEHGVDVQLSGHTHGGLVWGVGRLVALMNAGYLSGLYRVGATQLYVSPGTGCGARTPLRLGVPAEITLITLHPTPLPHP